MAAIISLLPFLVYVLLLQKKRAAIYFGVLFVAIAFLNIYWLWDVPNYLNTGKSATTAIDLSSKEFAYTNSIGIVDTASHNSLFYPLFNLFHRDIQINYNWPYLKIFNSWYLKLVYVNWIFFATVIIAGFLVNKHKQRKGIYYTSLVSFVLSIYFYTVNFGNLSFGNPGVEIFVWLNNNIPGFMMFRNMYDKFAYAMSFTYAFVFGVSLQIILENLRNKRLKMYLIGFVIVVVLLNIKPALLGEFNQLPIWTTNNTYNSVESLDNNYLNMVNYVEKMNDYSKFLTLPFAGGNVTAIKDDKNENHYYVGVSPFLILSGKNDFSGLMSFGNFQNEVDNALRSKNYEKLGRLFQIFNIRYVNLNKTISEELKNSYVYGDKIYYEQGDEFYKEILGEKIKDFGDNYSLYKINEKYDSAKIIGVSEVGKYLDYYKEFPYMRISDSQYEFDIPKDGGVSELIFLEPYHKKWALYLDGVKVDDNSHDVAYGYANHWDIGSLPVGEYRAKIYYEPKKYQTTANIVSFLCGLGAIIYCLIRLSKDRKWS
jgi:hypothetical protein